MNQPLRQVPKPVYKRFKPRRGAQGSFSANTRKAILKRDDELCVRCGAQFNEIHHIVFRSQGGKGTVDNGVCICTPCHILAHKYDKVRRWLEKYREKNLLPKSEDW